MKLRRIRITTKLDRRRERSLALHAVTGLRAFERWLRALTQVRKRGGWKPKDPIGKAIELVTAEFPEVYFNRVPDVATQAERVQANVHRESRYEHVEQRVAVGSMWGADSVLHRRWIEGKRWAHDVVFTRAFVKDASFEEIHGTLREMAAGVMRGIDQDEQRQREAQA